ncbi:type II secretion system F family protein [Comamonas composti]|uniref:type II secretion system F family protein n=1 Tax=Comamonas composti TaxID=408558 RepID=UPI00040C4029|nr:type II secretion system F family protein [Comamonas composti]
MQTMIASLLLALALVGCLVAVYKLFRQAPEEDRSYKDKPPRLFRLTWPVINLLANSLNWAIGSKSKERYTTALQRAGQDYALNPQQFFAGKVVSAITGALLGLVFQAMLEMQGLGLMLTLAVMAFFYPDLWLAEVTKKRNLAILKALPFFIDLLTLSIEAGLNLAGAMQQAMAKSAEGPLTVEINRVLRDVRAGKARIDALRDFAQRLDFVPVTSFVSALIQGEKTGSSLGPILRAQAEQRRTERFLRAEKMAMEAPVKMLGPLILFIFPCTFIVLGFPIAMKFLASGL